MATAIEAVAATLASLAGRVSGAVDALRRRRVHGSRAHGRRDSGHGAPGRVAGEARTDPLLGEALALLERVERAAPPVPPAEQANSLTRALLAEERSRYAWLDVGLWGEPAYGAVAHAALRLRAAATCGDELG